MLICILAILSVIFVLIDLNGGMSENMIIADKIIYLFFVFDYFVRLFLSQDKKHFIKNNLLDLIAILPFSSALRVFRAIKFAKVFRIAKLAQLTKLTRLIAFSGRLLKRTGSFLNTNGFKYMLTLCSVMILIGGILISYIEGMSFTDGIWWAFVTSTTVGYGDISPGTPLGRLVACVLMLCGIGLIGSLTSTITTFFINSDKQDNNPSNDRINMVLKLYGELNESEKEIFKDKIK